MSVSGIAFVLTALVFVGFLSGMMREATSLRALKHRETDVTPDTSRASVLFAMVFAGNALAFVLSVHAGLGPVLASSVVGIAGAVFVPKYAAAVFCGSFVGMSSPDVYSHAAVMLLAGGVAGVVFVLVKPVLNGFGGKLGTIAFAGTLIAALLPQVRLGSLPVPGGVQAVWVLLYATGAAAATYVLSVYGQRGPVLSSAIAGLVAGIVLPLVHGPDAGNLFAVVAFCSSFTGMSSPERLPSPVHVAIAGLVTGIVFLHATPFFDGAGGKLGTIAFASSIAVWGLDHLREHGRARLRLTGS